MREKRLLALKIFFVCFALNGILLWALLVAARRGIPTAAILGLGGSLILLLACVLGLVAGRALSRAAGAEETSATSVEKGKNGRQRHKEAPRPRKEEPARPSPYPAVQILSALQREGRLVDFLQEDLGPFEDAQIGAAVRNIHAGCRKAISEHIQLRPVFEQEEEGSAVTVQPGFDANAIRLTGNVAGDPPFRGVLRHRGWRVVQMDLPVPTVENKGNTWILSPAEVEME